MSLPQIAKLPERLTFDRSATIIFFIAVGFAACFMPAQNDTWWQLRAGEDIWRTGAISLRDTFSHTAYGAYWPDHEWLSQAIFYGLFRAGGLPLLTFFLALTAVATWAIVWRLTPGTVLNRIVLCGLALSSVSIGWSLRPQVVTLFLLALTLLLLERRRYVLLPVLFLVWVNLHGAVVLGLLLLGSANVGTLIARRRIDWKLAALSIGSIVATFLNPLGWTWWREMLGGLDRSRLVGIEEWHAPRISELGMLPFWILATAILGLALLQRAPRARLLGSATVWGALTFAPLALGSGRNVPAFVLLSPPALAVLLSARFSASKQRSRIEHPRLNAALVAAAFVLASAGVGYAWTKRIPALAWDPLPLGAINAIEVCPEQIYNRYDEGGYLVWFTRNRRVFLDGRQDPYPPSLILEQVKVESTGDFSGLFERYGVRCAFVPAGSQVASRLRTAGWHSRYLDERWAVLADPRNP